MYPRGIETGRSQEWTDSPFLSEGYNPVWSARCSSHPLSCAWTWRQDRFWNRSCARQGCAAFRHILQVCWHVPWVALSVSLFLSDDAFPALLPLQVLSQKTGWVHRQYPWGLPVWNPVRFPPGRCPVLWLHLSVREEPWSSPSAWHGSSR